MSSVVRAYRQGRPSTTLSVLIGTCLVTLALTACSGDEGRSLAQPSAAGFTSAPSPDATTSTSDPSASPSPTSPSPTPIGPPVTSCKRVVYVGESTSLGLVGPYTIAKAKHRLPAQLHQVGVRNVTPDILGARSIIEKWHNQPNAQDAVLTQKREGFAG